MPLNKLIKAIDIIKDRIDEHGKIIENNETRTRQVLVDPMLSALGWDMFDPNQVGLEYSIRSKRADYVLMKNGVPVAVIESKRMSNALDYDAIAQMLNYANMEGIGYVIATNGVLWNMYTVFEQAALEDRQIMELDILKDAPHETALKSLMMWRPNLVANNGPTVPGTPVLADMLPNYVPAPVVLATNVVQDSPTVPDGEWVDLMNPSFDPTGLKPYGLSIDGDEHVPVGKDGQPVKLNWVLVLTEVCEWLINNRFVTPEDCPIKRHGSSRRYLLNTVPVHESEENTPDFVSPRDLPEGIFVDVAGSADFVIDNLRPLWQNYGDPGVSVRIYIRNEDG